MTSAVKELRTERGWTQKQLAERLGVSPTLISTVENGHAPPGWELAMRIADLFEVPLEQIRTRKMA